jgi:hypothetical protein
MFDLGGDQVVWLQMGGKPGDRRSSARSCRPCNPASLRSPNTLLAITDCSGQPMLDRPGQADKRCAP